MVFSITGSPAQTGLLTALEALPYLVFGLLAGALADRVDRRRLMVGGVIAQLAGIRVAYLVMAAGVAASTVLGWSSPILRRRLGPA